jgi:acyl carrier protein
MEKFEGNIAEILEVEMVEMEDDLTSFACWDSLTILSIIVFAGERYSVSLTASEINRAGTVGGLKELIRRKM